MKHIVKLIVFSFFLQGCDGGHEPAPSGEQDGPSKSTQSPSNAVSDPSPAESGPVTAESTFLSDEPIAIEHPVVELPPASRHVARLTVDMLELSIAVIAGQDAEGVPIEWTLQFGPKQVSALGDEGLGKALGRPDYKEVTWEQADPTPLYLKFIDDMARDVCGKLTALEYGPQPPASPTLVRHSGLSELAGPAVDENLRYLSLRMLGEWIAPEESLDSHPLKATFVEAAQAGSGSTNSQRAREGWGAVCVALLTSPSFHLY